MGLPDPQTMDTDLERFTRGTMRRLLEILTDLNEPGFAFVRLATTGQKLSVLAAELGSHLNRAESKRSTEYTVVPTHMLSASGRIPWWRPDVRTQYSSFVQALISRYHMSLPAHTGPPIPKEQPIGPELYVPCPACPNPAHAHPACSKTQLIGPEWWKSLNDGITLKSDPTPPILKEQRIGDPTLWTEIAHSLRDNNVSSDPHPRITVVTPKEPTPPAPLVAPKTRTYQGFVNYVGKKHPMPAWKKNFARHVSGYWRGPIGMLWRANELPDYTAGETDAEYEVDGGKKAIPKVTLPPLPPHRPTFDYVPPPRPIPYPFSEVLRYSTPFIRYDVDRRITAPPLTHGVRVDENKLPYVMPPLPDTCNWDERRFRDIMEGEEYHKYVQLHRVIPRLALKQFAASWDCSKPSRLAITLHVSSVLRAMRRVREYREHQGYQNKTDLKIVTALITDGQPFALTSHSASDILDAVLRDHNPPREVRKFLCSLNFAQAMMRNRNTPEYPTYQTFLRCMIADLGWHVMARPNMRGCLAAFAKQIDRTPIYFLRTTEITNHTIGGFVSDPDKWVPNSNSILRWMYGQFDRLDFYRSMLRMLVGLRPEAEDAKDIQSLFYAAILAILTEQVDLPVDGADPVVLTEPAGDITLVTDQPVVTPTEPENDDNTVMINDQTAENPVLDPVPAPGPAPMVEAPDSSDWETDFTGCPAR